MRTILRAGLALLMLGIAPAVHAEELSEVEYYQQQALQYQLAQAEANANASRVECGEEPPANVFVAIPQYFHSRNDNAKSKVGGNTLKMNKGHANGAGITVGYNRRVSDFFSFGLMYQYTFMDVRSGMAMPEAAHDAGIQGREKSRWHSNVVGVLPEFNFSEFGKLQLSLIQGFDRGHGYEEIPGDRRDINGYGTNVTSLMAWYEKDFELGCDSGWKLTPYAGWRSLYVVVKDQNKFGVPAGTAGWRDDDNTWVHLISGGLKLSYQRGAFGFNVRGGVNHRNTHDDLPSYGNRAVAPGVVHFSHRANLDRTVGTVGAGINYAAHKRLIVSVGYDGLFGSDTSAHMGTLSFAIPF